MVAVRENVMRTAQIGPDLRLMKDSQIFLTDTLRKQRKGFFQLGLVTYENGFCRHRVKLAASTAVHLQVCPLT